MIELKCNNCGSSELMLEQGVYRCQSCGSRFLAERPDPEKTEKYRDKMIDAMNAFNFEKQAKYMNKLLDLNPQDPYAWTGKVWLAIEEGLDTHSRECVTYAKLALKYARATATEEEYSSIKDFMYSSFLRYGRKMMRLVPDLIKDIEKILKEIDLDPEYLI